MIKYILSKPVPFSCSIKEHEQLTVIAYTRHISRGRLVRYCLRYGLVHINEVIEYNRRIDDSQV